MKPFANVAEKSFQQTSATRAINHSFNLTGRLLAGLVLLSMLAMVSPTDAEAKKADATMQVSATVLTMLKIKVTSQPNQINIEQKHVSQGYIDVSDASAMLITSNSPAGFMMSVTHDSAMVSGVSATLSHGGTTTEGESQISVRTQQVRDEPMRISYRLYLNAQARVGSQPWPVALSFTPSAA